MLGKNNFGKFRLTTSALFYILFSLSAISVYTPLLYADEKIITSFGSGPTIVRLYTDYFCEPCRAAEPKLELLLTELLKKNAIYLVIVDTPVHKETPLYARYFIYIMSESKRLFPQVLKARGALFAAAKQNIQSQAGLESFLAKKAIRFKVVDVRPLLKTMEGYIKEDGINTTPSCAIYEITGKKVFIGEQAIIKALNNIADSKKH